MSKVCNTSVERQKRLQGMACTALMVVDQTPFLKKALSTCKRLRKELHKKQALLEDFEVRDRGAYQQWFNRTQGKKLGKNRDLREEVQAYQFILHHLTRCAHESFRDLPTLYDELLERKKDGSLFAYVSPYVQEDSKEEYDEEYDDFDEDVFDDDAWDDVVQDVQDFYDRVFGEGTSADDAHEALCRAEAAKKVDDDLRLKTCYRSLAKRLHPDHSELEESIRETRWHEIQVAYQNGDYEGLLRVEAICDMDEAGLSMELGLARLRDLAAYHKSHLLPIRNALSAAKKDIAFGFSKKGPTAQIKKVVSVELQEERWDLEEMLEYLVGSTQAIRIHVAAQIREQAMQSERSKRRTEKRQAKRVDKAKRQGAAKKVAARSRQNSSAGDDRQMSFF